jgi:hypothetical protein
VGATRRGQARWWTLVAFLGLAASLLVSTATSAGGAPGGPGGSQLETNLSHNGSDSAIGEPEIGIDPTHPSNLFTFWTTFPLPLDLNASVSLHDPCGGLVSQDRGAHWHKVKVPVNSFPNTSGCADAVVATGPDGTLYAGGIATTFTGLGMSSAGIKVGGQNIVVHGKDLVTRSTNWGRSWSRPVEMLGSDAERFVRGGAIPVDTFDRPWLAVDQSTGTVYASSANIVDHKRFVTASTDKARSFGQVYSIESSDTPQDTTGGGSTIAAAHGLLAIAYRASQAPGATCPCLIFETSTDRGATFTRHVVKLDNAASSPSPFLAADPTHKGRFAITVLDASGTDLQVYVTDDQGATWQGPTLVGEQPANQRFKPWLSYGPSGQLDLVWRTMYSDKSYDVWAATGREQGQSGAVFSAPLKVSSKAAPYPDGYYGGDDFSFIIGDDTFVHVGWGDSRSGDTQDWYGRIPRSAFKAG